MTSRRGRTLRLARIYLPACLLLLGTPLKIALAQEPSVAAALTAEQVVAKMVAMNQQRAEALRSYTASRVYHLEYHGLSHKRAEMVVKLSYQSPDRKEFTILSESGAPILRNRVLKRLLEAEAEAAQNENRQRSAIHPDNYEFRLVTHERSPRGGFYVLEARPKAKNKFLFRGRIWVDDQDFGIARIEGEPAKNPSWWTKRNMFQHTYQKLGEFWLPARNETLTLVRIYGRSLLSIEYKDYELTQVSSLQVAPGAVASPATSRAEGKYE